MRPEASTITPVPRRSSPRMRVDGCSRETFVWMCTTLRNRCLTSSTEASMGRGLPGFQMIAEELGDPTAGVGEGGWVERDGRAAALVRLVAVGDVGQIGPRLPDDVEVVVGLRIEDDPRIRAAPPHRLDHLDARTGRGPVVGIAEQHQERARHQLVDERVAPARIEADRRAEAGLGQHDTAPAGAFWKVTRVVAHPATTVEARGAASACRTMR